MENEGRGWAGRLGKRTGGQMREEGQAGRQGKMGRQTRERGQGTREEDRQVDKGRQVGEEDGDIVGGVQGIYI